MSDSSPTDKTAISIPTLPNLRDIGGYQTADGRRVITGQLYRSVMLSRLSDEDVAKVKELGLKTVFDLRTKAEREPSPDRDVGAREIALDVLADESKTGGPTSLVAKTDDPQAIAAALGNGGAEEMMKAAYRDLIELPSALSSYRSFFTDLAEADTLPALFHCTTGKDRTGWAAASTLMFLGVSEEDVYHDYLLTNDLLLPALQPMIDQFSSTGIDPAMLRPVLGVEREYLDIAISLMKERYGSIEGYMTDGLGLDQSILDTLKDRLLT